MKLADLLEEFNVVIDTAEGLTELRSLILGLAVRGKLVPQDPNDEPASELLKKIEAEKQRLYEEGEIRKPKKNKNIKEDEIPYKIPVGWKWVRLGEISNYGNHDSVSPEDISDDTWVLELADIEKDTSKIVEVETFKNRKSKSNKYRFQQGDVLYGKLRPYLNKVVIAPNDGVCSTEIIPLKCKAELVNKYLLYALKRDDFLDYANSVTYGTKMPRLGTKDGRKALMPLPPASEQHRIVQKIESLFAEVDELEAKLNRLSKLDEKLQLAVNAEVQQAPDAEASQSAWNFITSNFDTLYHTPEAIDNLKKNILNEAVRGRLVPQNPNEEPASELLKKIETEKERLYEEGEIRKPKKLPPVKEDEIPFEIPESWEWTHFEEAGVINPRNEAEDDLEASFVPMSLISEGYMEMHDSESRLWKEIKSGYTHFAENDIGLAKITPCFQNGKAAIFRGLKNGIGAGTTELYVFRSIIEGLIPEYVYAFLKTSIYITKGVSKMTGTAGQQRVPREYFETTPFPLPPAEEQHRIVKRIEELFAICDRFKAQLKQRQTVNERLVKGLVGEVLEKAGSVEKETIQVEEVSMAAEPGLEYRSKENARILEFRPRKTKSEVKALPKVNKTELHGSLVGRILVLDGNHNPKKRHTGRTKIEKTAHVIESHLKYDLGREPLRDARGAADFIRMRTKVEPMATKKGWFNVKDSEGKAHYSQGTRIEDAFRKSMTYFQKDLSEVDRIIRLFVPLSTRKAEVYQTTYAAWHDLLAMGYELNNDDIVTHASTKQFWHEEKEKIPKEKFYRAIEWLKHNDLVPDGKGKMTKPKS